jgi:hypothetical protein
VIAKSLKAIAKKLKMSANKSKALAKRLKTLAKTPLIGLRKTESLVSQTSHRH